jgi:predicted AlkP superfamily phosphohydrolase/phosphomutase
MVPGRRRKVLVIGWDAADWKIATPLLDQGQMPHLERLVNEGVMGNIATLHPMLSPLLWNSVATGKLADKHGILDFAEPDPQTGGVRPVRSTSRRVKAIWNILTQRNYRTHVLGWFAGHPAEPINGIAISDLYPLPTGSQPSE